MRRLETHKKNEALDLQADRDSSQKSMSRIRTVGIQLVVCLKMRLHTEQGKGRKSIILVGRERPVYALSKSDITNAGGIGENELWTKMSTSGMFLFVSANVRQLLDRQPDDLIGIITTHLIGELTAAETGSKPDLRSFATSRYNNAIKLLAGIADRLQCSAADEVLDHFEKQPPVEANHYRYHDEDEATTFAKIASTHSQLTTRAITHLVALLGRSESARTSTTIDATSQTTKLWSWFFSQSTLFNSSEPLDAFNHPLAMALFVFTIAQLQLNDGISESGEIFREHVETDFESFENLWPDDMFERPAGWGALKRHFLEEVVRGFAGGESVDVWKDGPEWERMFEGDKHVVTLMEEMDTFWVDLEGCMREMANDDGTDEMQ